MGFAKESGHFYDKDGKEAYQQPNKSKGGMRNTTITDARKLGLLPSVTTILKVLDKPGLNRWKENQILESALTLPHIDGESVDDFAKRIKLDSQEHGKQAREKGTMIHGLLEKWFMGADVMRVDYFENWIKPTNDALEEHFGEQNWNAEKSFASEKGFGGKVDLHSDEVVIDFKTSEFDENKRMPGYDEQVMQLAAYRVGLGLPNARCANVFISVSNPGLVVIREWKEEEIDRGYSMFHHALKFWNYQKKYFSDYGNLPF